MNEIKILYTVRYKNTVGWEGIYRSQIMNRHECEMSVIPLFLIIHELVVLLHSVMHVRFSVKYAVAKRQDFIHGLPRAYMQTYMTTISSSLNQVCLFLASYCNPGLQEIPGGKNEAALRNFR